VTPVLSERIPSTVPPESRGRLGWALGLLLLTLLGWGVRTAVLDAVAPVQLTGDEAYYVGTAVQLAQGKGHGSGGLRHAYWPPAQSFFLSLFVDVERLDGRRTTPEQRRTLMEAEVLLGALLVTLIALLGGALFDRRTGLLAGLLAALYPTFIGYSHYLWAETLFLVLCTGAFLCLVLAQRRRSLPGAAAAGVLFGAAALTREIGLLLAGASALWLLWVTRDGAATTWRQQLAPRALAQAALLLSLCAAVILPWTVRNYLLLDRFVPISTVGWASIFEGNTFGDNWLHPDHEALREFRRENASLSGEVERMEHTRREALREILEEQPLWLFKKLLRNTALLFSPDSFVFKKISRGCYSNLTRPRIRFTLVSTTGLYLLVLLAGLVGIAAVRGEGRRALPLLVFGVVLTLHVLANASSRYRLPLMPFLMVYAAYALSHGRAVLGQLSRPAALVCLALGLYALAWCAPYFAADAVSLWERGTYVLPNRP